MDRITAADFQELVQVETPRVSPAGDCVAFVRRVAVDATAYEATIYVVPTGGGAPRRFTLSEGVDSQPQFSPSGDRLAFVSTRGDDDRAQLWVVPTGGGEGRQVTNVVGGVDAFDWRPDGAAIAFTQRVSPADRAADRDLELPEGYDSAPPDPRVIDRTVYRSDEAYFDGTRSHVYVADLAGTVRRLTDDDRDYAAPEWRDETTLYFTVSVGPDPDDSLAYEIIEQDVPTGAATTVHTTTGRGTTLAATRDGRIAHTVTDSERSTLQQTDLAVLDAAAGTVTRPTAGLDRTLERDASPQWGPDGDRLYFRTPDEGAVALWATPRDGADTGVADSPKRVVREAGTSIDGVDVGEDVVAVVKSEWDHPGDVFVTTHAGTETRRLTRVNDDYLGERAVAKPEPVTIEGPAGPLDGWVLTPPNFTPEDSYPLVVEVHGGPHAMWTTSGTMFHEFQTLAARGYVVFWSNPRGSAGYGESFMQAIERDWGAVTAADVLAGVEQVTARDWIDDQQVFLTGGSFGGFMTAWLVGQTDRFTAAVTQRGVYDLTGFYGSTDAAYRLVEDEFDTTPTASPAVLWERSPVSDADAVTTPTLVLHADNDYRTPASTAELFYRLLRKHDVDTRLVRYPDEGHELSRSGQPGHIVDRIERIARWFDGYAARHDAAPALDRDPDAGLTAAETTAATRSGEPENGTR